MSNSINRVYLLGHLGNAPELRATAAGQGILRLRVATNDVWFDKDKNLQERTDWHDVVLFGPRAEALFKLLGKGDSVLVEGNLRTSSYEKDGVTRWRTEVVARDLCLTGRKRVGTAPPEPADEQPYADDASAPTVEVVTTDGSAPAAATLVEAASAGDVSRRGPRGRRGSGAEEAMA